MRASAAASPIRLRAVGVCISTERQHAAPRSAPTPALPASGNGWLARANEKPYQRLHKALNAACARLRGGGGTDARVSAAGRRLAVRAALGVGEGAPRAAAAAARPKLLSHEAEVGPCILAPCMSEASDRGGSHREGADAASEPTLSDTVRLADDA